jgi:hypothetical protein
MHAAVPTFAAHSINIIEIKLESDTHIAPEWDLRKRFREKQFTGSYMKCGHSTFKKFWKHICNIVLREEM